MVYNIYYNTLPKTKFGLQQFDNDIANFAKDFVTSKFIEENSKVKFEHIIRNMYQSYYEVLNTNLDVNSKMDSWKTVLAEYEKFMNPTFKEKSIEDIKAQFKNCSKETIINAVTDMHHLLWAAYNRSYLEDKESISLSEYRKKIENEDLSYTLNMWDFAGILEVFNFATYEDAQDISMLFREYSENTEISDISLDAIDKDKLNKYKEDITTIEKLLGQDATDSISKLKTQSDVVYYFRNRRDELLSYLDNNPFLPIKSQIKSYVPRKNDLKRPKLGRYMDMCCQSFAVKRKDPKDVVKIPEIINKYCILEDFTDIKFDELAENDKDRLQEYREEVEYVEKFLGENGSFDLNKFKTIKDSVNYFRNRRDDILSVIKATDVKSISKIREQSTEENNITDKIKEEDVEKYIKKSNEYYSREFQPKKIEHEIGLYSIMPKTFDEFYTFSHTERTIHGTYLMNKYPDFFKDRGVLFENLYKVYENLIKPESRIKDKDIEILVAFKKMSQIYKENSEITHKNISKQEFIDEFTDIYNTVLAMCCVPNVYARTIKYNNFHESYNDYCKGRKKYERERYIFDILQLAQRKGMNLKKCNNMRALVNLAAHYDNTDNIENLPDDVRRWLLTNFKELEGKSKYQKTGEHIVTRKDLRHYIDFRIYQIMNWLRDDSVDIYSKYEPDMPEHSKIIYDKDVHKVLDTFIQEIRNTEYSDDISGLINRVIGNNDVFALYIESEERERIEKEQREKEQREKEEKERLEKEQREKEEKERLEREKRQKEQKAKILSEYESAKLAHKGEMQDLNKETEDLLSELRSEISDSINTELQFRNKNAVNEINNNILTYLLSNNKTKQQKFIESLDDEFFERRIYDDYQTMPKNINKKKDILDELSKVIYDYNTVIKNPDALTEEQLIPMYENLNNLMFNVGLSKNREPVDKKFPKAQRNVENFVYNVQHVCVYLKALRDFRNTAGWKTDPKLSEEVKDLRNLLSDNDLYSTLYYDVKFDYNEYHIFKEYVLREMKFSYDDTNIKTAILELVNKAREDAKLKAELEVIENARAQERENLKEDLKTNFEKYAIPYSRSQQDSRLESMMKLYASVKIENKESSDTLARVMKDLLTVYNRMTNGGKVDYVRTRELLNWTNNNFGMPILKGDLSDVEIREQIQKDWILLNGYTSKIDKGGQEFCSSWINGRCVYARDVFGKVYNKDYAERVRKWISPRELKNDFVNKLKDYIIPEDPKQQQEQLDEIIRKYENDKVKRDNKNTYGDVRTCMKGLLKVYNEIRSGKHSAENKEVENYLVYIGELFRIPKASKLIPEQLKKNNYADNVVKALILDSWIYMKGYTDSIDKFLYGKNSKSKFSNIIIFDSAISRRIDLAVKEVLDAQEKEQQLQKKETLKQEARSKLKEKLASDTTIEKLDSQKMILIKLGGAKEQLDKMKQTLQKNNEKDAEALIVAMSYLTSNYSDILFDKKKVDYKKVKESLDTVSKAFGVESLKGTDAMTPKEAATKIVKSWILLKHYTEALSNDIKFFDSKTENSRTVFVEEVFKKQDSMDRNIDKHVDERIEKRKGSKFRDECDNVYNKVAGEKNNLLEQYRKNSSVDNMPDKGSKEYFDKLDEIAKISQELIRGIENELNNINDVKKNDLYEKSVTKKTKDNFNKLQEDLNSLKNDCSKLNNKVKDMKEQEIREQKIKEQEIENREIEKEVKSQPVKMKIRAAMESFNAISNIGVNSKHPDEFNAIKDAIDKYDTYDKDVESVALLYSACRSYLNCHTDNGRTSVISGQVSKGGRLRKQAVVKILDVIEGNAEYLDACSKAIAGYEKFYKARYDKENCPKLDLAALKRSLAKGSKEKSDNTIEDPIARTNQKAFAELEIKAEEYRIAKANTNADNRRRATVMK